MKKKVTCGWVPDNQTEKQTLLMGCGAPAAGCFFYPTRKTCRLLHDKGRKARVTIIVEHL